MEFCAEYGFDPERSVILRDISSSATLREVRKAFAQEDKVSQIAWVGDKLTGGGGMLCEFEEDITPLLLDEEHLNAEGNGYWKVVQISEICKPSKKTKFEQQNPQNCSDSIVDELVDHIQSLAQQTKLGVDEINQLVTQRLSGSGPKELQTPAGKPKPSTSTPYPRISQSKPEVPPLSLSPDVPSLKHKDKTPKMETGAHSMDEDGAAKSPLTFTIPSQAQKVIVEHVVKHDMSHTAYFPSRYEMRTFSGNHPKNGEVNFSTWRLYAKQLMRDTSLTDSQKRRQTLNSLLPPALNVALSIGDEAPPKLYLHELEKAYGNVTGGEDLYIQFVETHQQNSESPSEYLRRLHTLMQEVIEKKGLAGRHADTQLLKQFIRGCWDETLISQLRLREVLSDPSMDLIGYSDLLFKVRSFEYERKTKESRKSKCLGTTPVKARSHIQHSLEPSEKPNDDNADLVDRVKQLEDEMVQAKVKQAPTVTTEMQGRPQNKTKERVKKTSAPSHPDLRAKPQAQVGKLRGFCYKCGEESHFLANCNNPCNAELVQQKLLQRHQERYQTQVDNATPADPLNRK